MKTKDFLAILITLVASSTLGRCATDHATTTNTPTTQEIFTNGPTTLLAETLNGTLLGLDTTPMSKMELSQNVTTTDSTIANELRPEESCCEENPVNETEADTTGKSELTTESAESKPIDEDSNKIDNAETCANLDVRLCLSQDCIWYDAKCMSKTEFFNATGLFPAPNSFENAYKFLKFLWDSPPAQGNQLIWLVLLIASVVIAILLAKALLWLLIIYLYKGLWICCCKYIRKRNKKSNSKGRRIRLIMPDGRKISLDDYIIDLADVNARTMHTCRKDNKMYPDSMCSEKSQNGDFEVPWPFDDDDDDDDYSKCCPHTATASYSKKGKATSSKTTSSDEKPGCSRNYTESVACSSKYVNPAFSESSVEINKPRSKRTVGTKEKCDYRSDTDDLEGVYQEIQDIDGIYAQTGISAVDETAKGASSKKKATSSPSKRIPCLSGGEMKKKNANVKKQDCSSKLKKISPPEIAVEVPKTTTADDVK